jgi:hypothetical protein
MVSRKRGGGGGVAMAVAMLLAAASASRPSSSLEGFQPLSKIAVHKATVDLHGSAFVSATPALLGDQVHARHRRRRHGRLEREREREIINVLI